MNRKWKDIAWWAAFCALGALLVFHFSVIQIANMPMSPLKLMCDEAISRWVSPFFAQRWNFFAPQPIDRDTYILARAKYHDPVTKQEVVTGWIDVLSPLIKEVKKDRLSPIFLVEVCMSNVTLDFQNELAKNKAATYEKDGKRYIKQNLPWTIDPFNTTIMARTALATLEITYPGKKFEQVQLGLAHYEYPRFTQRHSKRPPVSVAPVTIIDWQPATWVAPYCCTQKGGNGHGA